MLSKLRIKIFNNLESVKFGIFTILTMVIGLVNTKLLSNHYNVDDFGRYQLLLTYLGVLSIFSMQGYNSLVIQHGLRGDDRYLLYVYKRVLPVALMFLVFIGLLAFYFEIKNFDIVIMGVLVASFTIFDKLSVIYIGKIAMTGLRYADMATAGVFLLLTTYAVFWQVDFSAYMLYLVLVYLATTCIRIIFTIRKIPTNQEGVDRDELDKFNKEAIKSTIVNGYLIFATWIERIILGFLSVNHLAVFAIALIFPNIIRDNSKSFLMPITLEWSKKGLLYQSNKINANTNNFLLFGLFLFFVSSLISYIAINNFFQKYQEATLYSFVLSINIIFIFLSNFVGHALVFNGYLSSVDKIKTVITTLKIPLVLILVPLFDIWGAVFSTVFFELLLWGAFYMKYKQVTSGLCMGNT